MLKLCKSKIIIRDSCNTLKYDISLNYQRAWYQYMNTQINEKNSPEMYEQHLQVAKSTITDLDF